MRVSPPWRARQYRRKLASDEAGSRVNASVPSRSLTQFVKRLYLSVKLTSEGQDRGSDRSGLPCPDLRANCWSGRNMTWLQLRPSPSTEPLARRGAAAWPRGAHRRVAPGTEIQITERASFHPNLVLVPGLSRTRVAAGAPGAWGDGQGLRCAPGPPGRLSFARRRVPNGPACRGGGLGIHPRAWGCIRGRIYGPSCCGWGRLRPAGPGRARASRCGRPGRRHGEPGQGPCRARSAASQSWHAPAGGRYPIAAGPGLTAADIGTE